MTSMAHSLIEPPRDDDSYEEDEGDTYFDSFPINPPRSPRQVLRLWTREEYYRAAETGVFHPNEHLELIDGEVWRKVSPQNAPHTLCVMLAVQVFREAFANGFFVREEKPLRAPRNSEPEPDIAVVQGDLRDYGDEHPTVSETVLVMEVSDTTLRKDRGTKSTLYAASGAPEYWILDLKKRTLEVRRDPQPAPKTRFGHDYAVRLKFKEDESVAPLAAPESSVLVRDLLPPPPKPKAA